MIEQLFEIVSDQDRHAIMFVLIMMLFDIASGFTQAMFNREVSSTIMREGLMHKVAMLFALVFGVLLQVGSTFLNFGFSIPGIFAIALFMSITEIVSISENIQKMNPELSALFDFLKERKRPGEKDENTKD